MAVQLATLSDLFLTGASLNPDHIAVTYDDGGAKQSLTYISLKYQVGLVSLHDCHSYYYPYCYYLCCLYQSMNVHIKKNFIMVSIINGTSLILVHL